MLLDPNSVHVLAHEYQIQRHYQYLNYPMSEQVSSIVNNVHWNKEIPVGITIDVNNNKIQQ